MRHFLAAGGHASTAAHGDEDGPGPAWYVVQLLSVGVRTRSSKARCRIALTVGVRVRSSWCSTTRVVAEVACTAPAISRSTVCTWQHTARHTPRLWRREVTVTGDGLHGFWAPIGSRVGCCNVWRRRGHSEDIRTPSLHAIWRPCTLCTSSLSRPPACHLRASWRHIVSLFQHALSNSAIPRGGNAPSPGVHGHMHDV